MSWSRIFSELSYRLHHNEKMQFYGFLLNILMIVGGTADLHKKLRYFETLKTVSVASRRKRSADGSYTDSKEVTFQALGRNFNLVLYPGTSVLSVNFQASTEDRFGRKKPFFINPNDFFTGHLADDESVEVEAHFENGILSSTISFPNETYAIEPAWRHLPPSDNHTMIAYKGSDVRWEDLYPTDDEGHNRAKMEDGIRLEMDETAKEEARYLEEQMKQNYGENRHKRDAGRKNLCTLFVVADYAFHRDVGITREGTALYLIGVLNRVNKRYKHTAFDTGMDGFGFEINEMLIHTEFNDEVGHYNEDVPGWGTREKLDAFSRNPYLQQFCLGHLFTSYPFERNVLGLAFIASEKFYSPGGICSVRSGTIYPNTGWTSALNKAENRLLTLQFELVTTHEFGHNWGAEHDPDTSECAPSSYQKGKYLMWPYSVSGLEENNQFFSPCSKSYISAVLRSKADICFSEEVVTVIGTTASSVSVDDRERPNEKGTGLCGNALVEENEECDAGLLGHSAGDPCCTDKCKLKPGAFCSGMNYECCRNCQIAPADTPCSEANTFACRTAAVCDGRNLTCPPATPADDTTPCLDKGECYGGVCLSFCEALGRVKNKDLHPCVCDQNGTAACRFCCMERSENGSFGSCEPTNEQLADGRTCVYGYCENGVCHAVETDLVQRIFDFFESVTISSLVAFMRANIVGTVLVLSIIIWVPASWIFSCIDKREVKEREYYRASISSRGTSLAHVPQDMREFRIRNSRFTRAPSAHSTLETRQRGAAFI